MQDSDDYGLTPSRIQYLAAYQENFHDHAETIANDYLDLLGHGRNSEKLTFYYSTIEIEYDCSTYRDRCTSTEDMPISYLWENEWRTEIPKLVAKKHAEAKAKAESERQEKLITAQQDKRTKELAMLAELKSKYEE